MNTRVRRGKIKIVLLLIILQMLHQYRINGIESIDINCVSSSGYNSGWEESRSARQGLNPLNLQKMYNYIAIKKLDINHLLILRNGFNVAEKDFKPHFYGGNSYDVNYIVKTVTATAIGMATKNNDVNYSQKVLDFFPEVNQSQLHPKVSDITIEHLLAMTAGFQDTGRLSFSGDLYLKILERPIVDDPGSKFSYDNYLYTLLAYIGRDYISDVLDELSIFVELMDITDQGVSVGYDGMTMSIDDVVKLGYLFLNKGIWESEKLISDEWLNRSLTKYTTINETFSYGYSWLINERLGCYSTGGFLDDQVFVIPKENTIIAFISDTDNKGYLVHYYHIIENILFNKNADCILGLSVSIPLIMITIVSMIGYSIIRKSKKTEFKRHTSSNEFLYRLN